MRLCCGRHSWLYLKVEGSTHLQVYTQTVYKWLQAAPLFAVPIEWAMMLQISASLSEPLIFINSVCIWFCLFLNMHEAAYDVQSNIFSGSKPWILNKLRLYKERALHWLTIRGYLGYFWFNIHTAILRWLRNNISRMYSFTETLNNKRMYIQQAFIHYWTLQNFHYISIKHKIKGCYSWTQLVWATRLGCGAQQVL